MCSEDELKKQTRLASTLKSRPDPFIPNDQSSSVNEQPWAAPVPWFCRLRQPPW
jgi:hypothetical protein